MRKYLRILKSLYVEYGFCYNKNAAKLRNHDCLEDTLHKPELAFLKDKRQNSVPIKIVFNIQWNKDLENSSEPDPHGREFRSQLVVFTNLQDVPENFTIVDSNHGS